ncbi:MAG: hypothetical protein M3367_03805, partial [Acidobacteriota bacterium]|nr:hypothetical protein [Acidobacteriota bacterium]
MKNLLPLLILILAFSTQTFAVDFTVNLTTDQRDASVADGVCDIDLSTAGLQCTLRAAVEQANNLAGNDRVLFNLPLNSTVTLTTANGGEILITNNGTLEITGTGANNLTIDGGTGTNRIFYTNQASVTISDVILRGGNGFGAILLYNGGAILAEEGSLTLDSVHVTGNGATPTHAILAESPVIDAGLNALAVDPFSNMFFAFDQRGTGFPRIRNGNGDGVPIVDISAFEVQTVDCSYSISPNNAQLGAAGGNTTVNVTSPSGCMWTATSNASWISVTNGNTGNGNGTVSLTVQANTGLARIGTVTIAGQIFTVTQASGCAYTLTPTSMSISASGGTGSFNVTSGTGCAWTAASNAPWITVTSGSSGTGNGTVSFSVQANSGPARTGTITAGGQTFTVNQASGCSYSLSATNANFGETGGNGSVNVSAGVGCTWSAVSNASWITVTAGGSGTGNGTVAFSVAANMGSSRTGTITIAGQIFTVTQPSGCTYALSSNGTAFSAAGGSGSFNVTTNAGCVWTAISNSPWLIINSGSPGNGNGAVSFTVQANVGPARTGTINVNGQIFTVTQASGCAFSIFPANLDVGASAGTGNFNINTGAGCNWTAVSNASWITITAGSNGSGSGIVTFSWTANTGPARTGTITAGGQTFTITQAALQTLSINNVMLNEGNSGTTAFTFTASLSAASNQTVSVNFATANGTATAGEDYTATSGTLTFAAGEVNKTLTVLVNGDTFAEGNETFTVNL